MNDSVAPYLKVVTIGDVELLEDEFGADFRKTVPDALFEVLFGQREPTRGELAEAGNDPALVPPLHTYAILDAAKLPFLLTGLIEGSGLQHQSLFQGKTAHDLAEYAPYLVKLEPDHSFTAALFTGPDSVNGLWHHNLAIFVRSRLTFADLRAHFRQFTRIYDDENKRWYYFAFYKFEAFHHFIRHYEAETYEKFSNGIFSFSVVDAKQSSVHTFLRAKDAVCPEISFHP